ncbi:MAG TPA: tetratricopeptide repeat protein [Aquificaceae bacterium]|nr:tetratricopeptide repeat protein [Aquificaceae bacterium]HIQ48166.1 tetratricopeptide repeat protein [Aquifex aeolicus]
MLLMAWEKIFPQTVGILPSPFSVILVPYTNTENLNEILELNFSNIPSEWRFFKEIYLGNFDKAKEEISYLEDEELKDYTITILKFSQSNDFSVLKNFKGHRLLEKLLSLLNPEEVMNVELTEREDFYVFSEFIKAKFLQNKDTSRAIAHLDNALRYFSFESPIFKAQVLLSKANIIFNEKGASYHLIQLYLEILELLKNVNIPELKGEIFYQLGNLYSTFGDIYEAVKYYSKALEVFTKENNPYMYALINNNMGLAYLSIQATDIESQVKLALGVQCLKKALEVFKKEEFPEEWASATLNYANALVYLPTSNPTKNLIRALELYKEVLAYREKTGNMEGYARVLANMGNVLAHLGHLKEAKKKLKKAREIFISLKLFEEAAGVDEILKEIQSMEAAKNGE